MFSSSYTRGIKGEHCRFYYQKNETLKSEGKQWEGRRKWKWGREIRVSLHVLLPWSWTTWFVSSLMSLLELATCCMKRTGNCGVKYFFLMLQLQFLLRCKLNVINWGIWTSEVFNKNFKQLDTGVFCSSSLCSSALLTQTLVAFKLLKESPCPFCIRKYVVSGPRQNMEFKFGTLLLS